MGIAQLFVKKGNYIDTIQLDIVIIEGASATATVTENPVENGADVNDHIIIQPLTFTVQGVVSDISSTLITSIKRTFTAIRNFPESLTKSTSRSKEAWEALLELQASKTPFTLVQGLKTYENVIIISLNETQDKDTSRALFFTATMREIIFVGSEILVPEQFNDAGISDSMVPATQGGLKQVIA